MVAASAAQASPIDAGYPPPGGVTFSTNATVGPPAVNAGLPGGVTNSYSNFDPSQYSQLWFGLKNIDMGQGPGGDGLYDLTAVGAFGGSTSRGAA